MFANIVNEQICHVHSYFLRAHSQRRLTTVSHKWAYLYV